MIDKSGVMMKTLKPSDALFKDLRELIMEARQEVARQVNSALVLLYWRVGKRIRQDILREKRAGYGEQIIATLSQQLGWSSIKEIIPLGDDLKRNFYAEMCWIERWSVRTLRQKISSMLFERTALSRKPKELAKQELTQLQEEHVKLLQLDKSGICVAEYLTELPPRKLLQRKLHEAILLAQTYLREKNREPESS